MAVAFGDLSVERSSVADIPVYRRRLYCTILVYIDSVQ